MAILQTNPENASSNDDLVDDLIEETTANNPVEVIETVIASLAAADSAMVNHSDKGYLWKFQYGTVEVFVQLTGVADEDSLTVWSSVLKLPAKEEPQLMRKLLEMNWTNTLEARFAILDQQVIVVSTRSLADLSPGEISRAITIVATIADDNDEVLKEQFGGS